MPNLIPSDDLCATPPSHRTAGERWIIDLAAEDVLGDSAAIDRAVASVFEHLGEWQVELRVRLDMPT
jgi:hypothetical protein